MSSTLILIIDEKGNEIKRFVNGYHSFVDGFTFYARDDAASLYPTYTSGKCKGPIAFKKDGTLVLSADFFTTIKMQNGFLKDGDKNVYVSCPSLDMQYTKTTMYDYRLIELLKESMERDIGHIHSLETLHLKHEELCVKWKALRTCSQVEIKVEKRPMICDHLWIEGFYIGNSNDLNRVIEHFGFPEGESVFNFRADIYKLKEEPFTYNAVKMGWITEPTTKKASKGDL